jgi:hypothetical protein
MSEDKERRVGAEEHPKIMKNLTMRMAVCGCVGT